MICPRCIARRATQQLSCRPASFTSTLRPFSSISSRRTDEKLQTSAAAAAQSTPQRSPPAATSTSAAQPFSTPETLGPAQTGAAIQPKKAPARPKSSTPAGTIMRGLNYMKGKQDPVALEDHEYPDWLWTILDEKPAETSDDAQIDPRIYSKSANARRKANKAIRKATALAAGETAARRIPLYEQSIDLPRDSGASGDARIALTRSMRGKRRKDIKEANFLQSMR